MSAQAESSTTRPWVIKLATALVLLVVMSAFALSFTVLRDLAAVSGIPANVSWLWPVIADGTIAAATLVLYASRGHGPRDKALPTLTLVLFALVSVVGNVSHILLVGEGQAIPWTLRIFVGLAPPLGLLLTIELLVSLLRTVQAASTPAGAKTTTLTAPLSLATNDAADVSDTVAPGVETTVGDAVAVTPVSDGHVAGTDDTLYTLTAPVADTDATTDGRDGETESDPTPAADGDLPTDAAGQVEWVVDRIREGKDVTTKGLIDLFDLNERTAQRRLSKAREQIPDKAVA